MSMLGQTGLWTFDRRAAAFYINWFGRACAYLNFAAVTPKAHRGTNALRRPYHVRFRADAAPDLAAGSLIGETAVVYSDRLPVLRALPIEAT